ncbi:hypothetical protein [Paenibacillus soyae]|uniref:Uncharacterized protein n=1 Tax=Paenibacillus soyae TaxID=2969249 RepID=A0A9X2MKV1_9BACL|nr:hypothetical protein [Paenibacillus soyae]MCR2802464.1 hypothetical protein [Paenibacillus soyae]
MQEKQDQEKQVCQWCLSEIIWDEEIGPETHCPHCENELGGYRSVQIGLDSDEDDDSTDSRNENEDEDWLDDEKEDLSDRYNEEEGFRGGTRSMLAAESVVQRIIDEQLEAPECPSCREYMMEAGVQTIDSGFRPTESTAIGISVVPNPFKIVWYVCPACYHTASFLSLNDREEMLNRLAEHS